MSNPNHETSLNNIENFLENIKNDTKESFKKVKNCRNENDHNLLINKFNNILDNLSNIHQESFKLDDLNVWETFLEHTDKNTFPEYEKRIYDDFVFIMQLTRGKLNGLKEFSRKIEDFNKNELVADDEDIDQRINNNLKQIRLRQERLKRRNLMENNAENENLGFERNNYNLGKIDNDLHNMGNTLNNYNSFTDLIKGNKFNEILLPNSNIEKKQEDQEQNDVQNFLLNMNQFDEI